MVHLEGLPKTILVGISNTNLSVELWAVSFGVPSNAPGLDNTPVIAHKYSVPKLIATDDDDNF